LAQAEHDPDARVVLLTWDPQLARAVQEIVSDLCRQPHYPDFLARSLSHSALLRLDSRAQCVEAANRLAPEHLHLAVADAMVMKDELRHYGGLFVGYATTVPFGDYGAGPNHTLPTAGTARFSAGLSPLTFLRPQCWLQAHQPRQLAQDTALFATQEGLLGHAAAARARLN
jgi:phosphoribosyl-ATP pyrophosphohydrolase/phosphoribosyl-AMP cyclohydrolase/histidinol dehydrogenase